MARFKKHLFICMNERKPGNPKGCCARVGSLDLIDYAKGRTHELGLKGMVRINKAGCLDACSHGPSMVIYPDGVWYAPKSKNDIEEIIQEHILKDNVVKRLMIDFKK